MDRSAVVVAVRPLADPSNAFAGSFAEAIRRECFEVREFDWSAKGLTAANVAIVHWPYELLGIGGWKRLKRLLRIYRDIRTARRKGLKLVWVAHNIAPHDGGRLSNLLMRLFLRHLDGVIHLSAASRRALQESYPVPAHVQQIETVHGHYLDTMATPVRPISPVNDEVRLCYFGQVRRYKNVETLADAVEALQDDRVRLSIVGRRMDAGLASELEAIAARSDKINLQLSDAFLTDQQIEQAIDDAHGVVLPYRAIMNSGAAVLALSRGRPILAPRMGSLPELADLVGSDWVRLFDGELDGAALQQFVDWLRTRSAASAPDLSSLDWKRVGRDIAGLVDRLSERRGGNGH